MMFVVHYLMKHGFSNIDKMNEDDFMVMIYRKYTRFKLFLLREKKSNTLLYRMLKKKLAVYIFWKSHDEEWSYLQTLALKVFTMSCSIPSFKLIALTFGFIHTKACNRLFKECIRKLVYLKLDAFYMSENKILYEDLSNEDEEDEE